jgi:hypothetical protein
MARSTSKRLPSQDDQEDRRRRVTILLDHDEYEALRTAAFEERISQAEILRQGLRLRLGLEP